MNYEQYIYLCSLDKKEIDPTGDASGAENDEGLESRSLWQDLQG